MLPGTSSNHRALEPPHRANNVRGYDYRVEGCYLDVKFSILKHSQINENEFKLEGIHDIEQYSQTCHQIIEACDLSIEIMWLEGYDYHLEGCYLNVKPYVLKHFQITENQQKPEGISDRE